MLSRREILAVVGYSAAFATVATAAVELSTSRQEVIATAATEARQAGLYPNGAAMRRVGKQMIPY